MKKRREEKTRKRNVFSSLPLVVVSIPQRTRPKGTFHVIIQPFHVLLLLLSIVLYSMCTNSTETRIMIEKNEGKKKKKQWVPAMRKIIDKKKMSQTHIEVAVTGEFLSTC